MSRYGNSTGEIGGKRRSSLAAATVACSMALYSGAACPSEPQQLRNMPARFSVTNAPATAIRARPASDRSSGSGIWPRTAAISRRPGAWKISCSWSGVRAELLDVRFSSAAGEIDARAMACLTPCSSVGGGTVANCASRRGVCRDAHGLAARAPVARAVAEAACDRHAAAAATILLQAVDAQVVTVAPTSTCPHPGQ